LTKRDQHRACQRVDSQSVTLYGLTTHIWAKGAGFMYRTKQRMCQPIMTILVQPCWDFFLGVGLSFINVCVKPLNSVF
jgi:hypothetical protein